MKKLYTKNELTFAIIWIVLYVVLLSIADSISASCGIQKLITAPLCVIMTVFLFVWVKKSDLMNKYGLCKFKGDAKKYFYFLPLIILCSTNLWNGVTLNLSILETTLYIVSMLCVGFLEELIFRGFLFRAMCKDNVKTAIIISSVTFGIGHIINLVNGSGAELIPNLLQVVYASAAGFMFVMMYYKSQSLIGCIAAHGVFNSLSVFAYEASVTRETRVLFALLLTAITSFYAVYIALTVRKKN